MSRPSSSPESSSRPQPKAGAGAGKPETLSPGLYIVSTPIGNAADLTLRARDVLAKVNAIVAEDTRVSQKLMGMHGISNRMLSYNDHNGASMRPKLLAMLKEGQALALISDAGTPLISDPGYRLVGAALEEGIAVTAVPGPSAALAALCVSGLPSDRFFFAGFLPAKAGERASALAEIAAIPATLIFYESPNRIAQSLGAMAEALGPRPAAVARELTKLYEDVKRGTLAELAASYKEPPKGEIVVVVGPPGEGAPASHAEIDALLGQALAFMPVKPAAQLVADALKLARRDVYARALALKDKN